MRRERWRIRGALAMPRGSAILRRPRADWAGPPTRTPLVTSEPFAACGRITAWRPPSTEVLSFARRYVHDHLVPMDVGGDALHLAVACVHEVDFLLTWTIRHLANPNKFNHLVVINRRLGLLTPQIVTPEMLWLE